MLLYEVTKLLLLYSTKYEYYRTKCQRLNLNLCPESQFEVACSSAPHLTSPRDELRKIVVLPKIIIVGLGSSRQINTPFRHNNIYDLILILILILICDIMLLLLLYCTANAIEAKSGNHKLSSPGTRWNSSMIDAKC